MFRRQRVTNPHGGCLPEWEVADLPAPPPYRFGRALRGITGPGIIALGISIGSGEWLLGPSVTARYGGSLLWIATVAVLLSLAILTAPRLITKPACPMVLSFPLGLTCPLTLALRPPA